MLDIDITRYTMSTTRSISANWTINTELAEQTFFGINMDDAYFNMLRDQVALDIDREIMNDVLAPCDSNTLSYDYESLKNIDLDRYRKEVLVKKYGFR